jgi:hypothetical protein
VAAHDVNDLFLIEYKPELMLSDSIDMDAATELAHRRLCDFIWRLDCAPRHDVAWLEHFTKCPVGQWPAVEVRLFQKGWTSRGGFLVHQGAIESHNEAKAKYAAKCNQTATALATKTRTKPKLSVCRMDEVTGLVTIIVTEDVTKVVTTDVTRDVTENVTTTQSESKSKSEPKPPGTGTRSQTSQSTPKARGTKLTFSMLSRIALEIRENQTEWHYDNHKLSPDKLITAGLVATLRPYVDRITDAQARETWAEAALRTHQAAVDGMSIRNSLAHYAVGIWRDLLEKIATPITD